LDPSEEIMAFEISLRRNIRADARARSEYVLRSEEDGTTTLSYNSRIEPRGLLTKIFSPMVKPFVRRVFDGEMKTFIRSLEEDYHRRKTMDRKVGA
jgi:hypothetical protein